MFDSCVNRYASLRRHLLIDPHLFKDGSRSPDLTMDNPLSQNPGMLLIPRPSLLSFWLSFWVDSFHISTSKQPAYHYSSVVNYMLKIIHVQICNLQCLPNMRSCNDFIFSLTFNKHFKSHDILFLFPFLSHYLSALCKPWQIAHGVAFFKMPSWKNWLTRIYHVCTQSVKTTFRCQHARPFYEEYYWCGA